MSRLGRPRPARRQSYGPPPKRRGDAGRRSCGDRDRRVAGHGLAPLVRPYWALADGTVFARDREAHALSFGPTHAIRHALARATSDRYYGLGDKTGPLDLHGRRLRTRDAGRLGFDPEHGDPLYKHWPFLIARDGASGVAHGVFYDNGAGATFDLGCEHDNYYGLYRGYEAEGGDLDYYLFLGPRLADVTRKFLALTGAPGAAAALDTRLCADRDGDRRRPDAQERMEAFIDRCAADDIPVSASISAPATPRSAPKRYVFNWNREKFPDPKALMRRFHAAGMHVVANLKPCLLDDHPRYAEPRAGRLCQRRGRRAAISQFWDGEGAHLDFTNPDGIAWWQRGPARAGARLRHRRRLERQQRIRVLGRGRGVRTASARRCRSISPARCSRC